MARIAIVINASWNIWNFRLPLLKHLADQGHEIIAIAPQDDYSQRIPYEYHHVKMISRSTNPINDFRIYQDLYRVFKKTSPDVILLYTIKPNVYGNFAASRLGIPTISNIAGLGNLFIHKSLVTEVARKLYRWALKHPATVFFQNAEDRRQFVVEKLVSEEKTGLLTGSGIDLKRFTPTRADKPVAQGRPFVFLLPSRMLWDKGVGEFAAAAKRILDSGANAEFRLLGVLDADNPKAISSSEMEKLVDDSGVVYAGTSDRIEDEILASDCVVLPSYREGLPRSLLEASAMNRPVIATDVPGCRDVVEDGVTGYLCRARDAGDLEQKMRMMIAMEQSEREAMGRRGREKMEREFDQRFVFEKYSNAIEKALGFKFQVSGFK